MGANIDCVCHDPRKCFAKGPSGGCSLLLETYPQGVKCKFCKPDRNFTNGKWYPVDSRYGNPKKLMVMRVRDKRNEGLRSNADRLGGRCHSV